MALVAYLPLAAALLLAGVVALARVDRRVDRVLTRVALALFGAHVARAGRRRRERRRRLRAAHAPVSYRAYAARTLLYAALFAVVGSLAGIYAIPALPTALALPEDALRVVLPGALEFLATGIDPAELTVEQLFLLLLASSAVFGAFGGFAAYYLRWWLPARRAEQRRLLIDEGLARTVAFVFALSRSGMAYPDILRTVARNRAAYGEAAEELTVVVRRMDALGTDLLTATERVADATPSEEFADFAGNLVSVLRSGRNVPGYLREQYEQHQRDREARQEQLLELLAALAEGYVAALVAGPLFLITILVVFGLLVGDTLGFLQAFVYLFIPIANVGFIRYLDDLSATLWAHQGASEREVDRRRVPARRADGAVTAERATPDGGEGAAGGAAGGHAAQVAANRQRLAAYDRIRWLRRRLAAPARTVRTDPLTVLYVTVPVAALAVLVRAWPMLAGGRLDVRVLDDLLIQSVLFVVVTFAVVQEFRVRWLREVDEVMPDFLDRLASSNEAGMTFVHSLERIEKSDLGVLDAEIERLVADLRWGARAENALYRFENRIGSAAVSRAVALITNAMNTSNNIAPVLRIAAAEAKANRRLQRKRRQDLFTYVLVVYLSFLVFLGIVVVLQVLFIPSLPSAEQFDGLGGTTAVARLTAADRAAYELVFFHAAVIQAFFSGLVVGQMNEGSVLNGAKHVAVMLTAAYALFLVI